MKKRNKGFDVITVGSSTLDVFATTAFSEIVKIIDPNKETDLLAYPSGSKILINQIEHSSGGSGTNAGVCLSRLGLDVGYLGKMGDDSTGETILKELKKEKIPFLGPVVAGHSGYSVILETLENDRTILAYKGVNNDLRIKEVPINKMKTKWFYFGSMMDQSFETQKKLAAYAEKNHIRILFNPSHYLASKGCAYLAPILRHTHILAVNREEAACLVGDYPTSKMCHRLLEQGPEIVIITQGKKEVHVGTSLHHYMCTPPKSEVVDCTGAGDAFAASFLSGVISKKTTEECIKRGIINSASVLQQYGAKAKLLTRAEMARRLKKVRLSVKKHRW